jgi:hypothetical protein
VTRDVSVSVVATNYYFELAQSYAITTNNCSYVLMELMDGTGSLIPPTSPINLLFSVSTAGTVAGDVTLYTDSICTTGVAENTYAPINPYNGPQYKFYIKVAPAFTGSSLSLIFSGTGLLTLPTAMYLNMSVGP